VAQYGRVWVKDDARSYLGHLPTYQMEEGVTSSATPSGPVARRPTRWSRWRA